MIDPAYFKDQKAYKRSRHFHPVVFDVMVEMIVWVIKRGLQPCITETVTTLEEDEAVQREFATHREGRAFDMRCLDWTEDDRLAFEKYFKQKYNHLGAISSKTGKPKLILLHVGTALHFHLQFSRGYQIRSGNERGESL